MLAVRTRPPTSAGSLGILAALVGGIALIILPAFADEPTGAERFHSVVACSKVFAEEGRIEARAGGKTVELVGAAAAAWREHTVVRLDRLEAGSIIHVLARKQASQTAPGGSTISPRYISVSAIVAGEFTPPPLAPSQAEAKLEWVSGPIGRIDGKEFTLANILLQAGADRLCISIVSRTFPEVTAAAEKSRPLLDKGTQLRASGRPAAPAEAADEPAKKKAPPRIALERAEILAREFPAKEYAMILGTAK